MDEKCAYYRGVFIHHATLLEAQIDDMLVDYFCGDDWAKREELMYLLFYNERGAGFMCKYQALSFLMHKYFGDFYEKHSPKKSKNKIEDKKTLDKRVIVIIELRNKFAHRKINKGFGKVVFFDGDSVALDVGKAEKDKKAIVKEYLDLSAQKMEDYQKEITDLRTILMGLSVLIKRKNKKE